MGYSVNDLKNGAKKVQDSLDERTERRGKELADNFVNKGGFSRIFIWVGRWFAFLAVVMALSALPFGSSTFVVIICLAASFLFVVCGPLKDKPFKLGILAIIAYCIFMGLFH